MWVCNTTRQHAASITAAKSHAMFCAWRLTNHTKIHAQADEPPTCETLAATTYHAAQETINLGQRPSTRRSLGPCKDCLPVGCSGQVRQSLAARGPSI